MIFLDENIKEIKTEIEKMSIDELEKEIVEIENLIQRLENIDVEREEHNNE